MSVCMLTGSALRSEATRLAIPGRSRMSADELRAAITAATTPRVRGESAREYHRELAAAVLAVRPQEHPFRARNGKRKPSRTRIRRHR